MSTRGRSVGGSATTSSWTGRGIGSSGAFCMGGRGRTRRGESCNVGLTPVINPNLVELTRVRLSHVDQDYLRAETLAAANALLIKAQSRVELAQRWGGGLLASVDGLRFVVPVRTINAAPSPKFFGYKQGLTWLNAVNDQVSGIGAVVVSGTRFANLAVSKRDGVIKLDPHVDGSCRLTLAQDEATALRDALIDWLG